MAGKGVDRSITLFGVKISVPRNSDDQNPDINSVQERPNYSLNLHGFNNLALISRNHTFHAAVPTYNRIPPLPYFHGVFSGEYCMPFQGNSHSVDISNPTSRTAADEKSQMKNKKRKNHDNNTNDDGKKKPKSKKRVKLPEEEEEIIPSLDDIPRLVEIIMSENDTKMPVFLYRKRLEDSDVEKQQNRLLINGSFKLMGFLREEERSDVMNSKKGLQFSGIDSKGKVYDLRLIYWPSVKKIVINSKGWSRMIRENNAKKGDWVHLWGFRQRGELRLAFDFRKAEAEIVEEAGSCDVASSSASNGGVDITS